MDNGFINNYLEDLKGLSKCAALLPHRPNAPSTSPKWISPPSNLAKINVDTDGSHNEEKRVVVAFCRGCNGVFLGASIVVFRGVTEPSTLETLACQEALALAEDLDLQ
jgi:hypothetical protein